MGRPARSIVRERLAEMLFVAGKLTAYDAHKHYIQLFSSATQRNVYYQLRRGVEMGVVDVATIVWVCAYSTSKQTVLLGIWLVLTD